LPKKSDKNLLESIRITDIWNYSEENGYLIVVESKKDIPYLIQRTFVVFASANQVRGQHAHKKCSQFLICLNGSVDVKCDDGMSTSVYSLTNPFQGLMIPPGIWAEQIYKADNSIMMVLCDQKFEEEEYIRDYGTFISFKNSTPSQKI
jgi:dTDP-4-dehydrorhamnose 3,5-epimerase-like enzyme